ncbi:hypothetical protein F4782DRAFT_94104 [Xylaria castorea]|nr:hypothetical protein F4782DRAFT_94104 [Xylaria castorea]
MVWWLLYFIVPIDSSARRVTELAFGLYENSRGWVCSHAVSYNHQIIDTGVVGLWLTSLIELELKECMLRGCIPTSGLIGQRKFYSHHPRTILADVIMTLYAGVIGLDRRTRYDYACQVGTRADQ